MTGPVENRSSFCELLSKRTPRSRQPSDRYSLSIALVSRPNFHVAKSCRGRAVSGSHHLLRLPFAAVRCPPEHPLIMGANCVQGIPELGGDARVRRIFQHASTLAILNFPSGLTAELKVVALVVNRPGAVRLHVNARLGVCDELLAPERFFPRKNADVGHANNRQPIPAFSAQRAARAARADSVRRLTRAQISREQAVRNDRGTLRGHPFVIESKCAEPPAILLASIGDDIHQIAALTKNSKFFEGRGRSAGKIGFHPENAIELDGMPDRFVNL